MKYIILWIVLLSCSSAFGQTAKEYCDLGEQEERKSNFDAAIKGYSKAIEIDPASMDAYYLRAKLLYDAEQYQAAIADLDKAIALQPGIADFHVVLLKLRGEGYLKIKDKEKACKDFIEANKSGGNVEEAYLELCNYQRIKNERIYVNLPDKTNWKIQEQSISIEDSQHIILLINEKKEERLRLISRSGVKNSDFKEVMDNAYNNLKGKSGATKLSFIETDLSPKEPWAMYAIQHLSNETRNREETQVWLFIQGENCLHTCIISMQNDSFTNEHREAIIRFLKTAKIVYN